MIEETTIVTTLTNEFRKTIASIILFNDQVVTQTGMSHSAMQSLHLLQMHGPLSPGRLAGLTGLTSGAVTAVVDSLEAMGLVSRERHATDRRRVVIVANEGRIYAAFGQYYTAQGEHLSKTLAAFTPAELEVMAKFFEHLNAENVS